MAIWTRNSPSMSTTNSKVNYRVQVKLNSQSTSNNRSSVTVLVHVWRNNTGYTTYGTGTVYVTIDGKSYSASINSNHKFSYNSYTQVFSKTVTINHNSDGGKRLHVDARISHNQFSSNSQRYSTDLNAIPRASSFTVSGNTLGSSVDVSINRASSSFTHEVIYDLPVGSRRAEWSGISTSKTFTPSLSDAKYLSSTATSGKGRITVNTYSGSTLIGTTRKDFTFYIPDSVKPNISGLSASIAGSGHDKSIGKYVQNISKVYASFNSSALYGASISSRKITIKRKSDGGNSQTINSGSGTTNQPVSLSGEYEVRATVKDSRGRSNNADPIYFDVHTYSPPRITQFTTVRRAGEQATVDIVRQGSWSSLNGDNYIDISVDRQEESGWVNLESVRSNETGGIIKKSLTDTDRDTWSSYNYRVIVSDDFGNEASAESSVTTERVVLDIHKDAGIGIGKIHEQGVLDIDGDVYSNGILYTVGGLGSITIPAGADLNDYTANGFYHNRLNKDVSTISNTPENNSFSLLVQRHAGIQQTFTTYGGANGTSWKQYIRHFYSTSWGPWERVDKVRTGVNSDSTARWWRFGGTAGLQICTGSFSHDFGATITKYVNLPASFRNTDYFVSIASNINAWEPMEVSSTVGAGPNTASQMRFQRYNNSAHNRSNGTYNYRYVAIGRWN